MQYQIDTIPVLLVCPGKIEWSQSRDKHETTRRQKTLNIVDVSLETTQNRDTPLYIFVSYDTVVLALSIAYLEFRMDSSWSHVHLVYQNEERRAALPLPRV